MSEERKEWQNPESILDSIPINKNMVVADLACGPGYFTIPISKKVAPDGTVYAVDSNEIMLQHLSKNLKAVEHGTIGKVVMLKNDISDTEIPSGMADVVFFANILHDIVDRNSFFAEVKRISKKSAKIVNIDWLKTSMDIGPPVEIRLSENESKKIVTQGGLRIERDFDAGPYHYAFVCSIG